MDMICLKFIIFREILIQDDAGWIVSDRQKHTWMMYWECAPLIRVRIYESLISNDDDVEDGNGVWGRDRQP